MCPDRLLRLFHKAENNSSSKSDESFPSSYVLKNVSEYTSYKKTKCKSNTMVPMQNIILTVVFDDDNN